MAKLEMRDKGKLMDVRYFVIAVATSCFLGCGGPSSLSEMQADIDSRLLRNLDSFSSGTANSIQITSGFIPALRSSVLLNEAYLSAQAIELEAMGQVGVAESFRRPQLLGNINFGGIRELDTIQDDETNTGVAGGLNLSQLVYDGGAAKSAINRATAAAISAEGDRIAEGNRIALEAASSWLNLWQHHERLKLMDARISVMDKLIDQIERMSRSGLIDRASVDSARRQIVDVKLERSRLQAQKANSEVLFERYFGLKLGEIKKPSGLISADECREYSKDWLDSPILRSKAAQVLAAEASVSEARAAFRPVAQIRSGAQSPWEKNESTDLTLGMTVEYAFNDGGRRKKTLASAEARLNATSGDFVNSQRALKAEVDSGLSRLSSIETSMPLLDDKLRLSRSEAEASRSQLLTGQSNLRFLIEAEIEIYRAQDQKITMLAERDILSLTIAALTGALGKLIDL